MPRFPSRNKKSNNNSEWDDTHTQRITNAEKKNRPQDYDRRAAAPYSIEETHSWLKHIWSDEWWITQMPVSTHAIDAVIGGGAQLRGALDPNKPEKKDESLKRVSWLIPDIERRALVFIKTRGAKQVLPKFLRLETHPTWMPKLCAENVWTLWSKCASCGSNKFLPVTVSGKPHAACYVCCHPEKNSYGGRIEKKSLIQEALKKYY